MTNKKERKQRVRKKMRARSTRPRLSVFVSNQHIYAQIIDDSQGETLAQASDKETEAGGRNVQIAQKVGLLLAQKAREKKVKEVVFDRGPYKFHGRVKALAEGAKEGGLEF